MNALRFSRNTISAVISLAFIAGCGAQTAAVPPTVSGGAQMRLRDGRPATSSQSLIYAANNGSEVDVFSYPQGDLIGTLTGFSEAFGLCSDNSGNVFVTNNGHLSSSESDIVEYAHGGTSPIATLPDPNALPHGCSVDPKTGDLAVANWTSERGDPGVAIYSKARGEPTLYSDGDSFSSVADVAYDDHGNLFLIGYGTVTLAELPAGSTTFVNFSTKFQNEVRSIRWDGRYLAISGVAKFANVIYRVSVSGSQVTIVNTMPLKRVRFPGQFAFVGQNVVMGFSDHVKWDYQFGYWSYPTGGKPLEVVGTHHFEVGGLTISTIASQ